MQRYNIFYLVHKGLKQLLYQTSGNLLQADFDNPADTNLLFPQLSATLDLLYKHTAAEHAIILPAIIAAEPSSLIFFEEEQTQQFALINRTHALINMFHHAVSSEEKIDMGSAIRQAFSNLLLYNVKQMASEEQVVNKLLWQCYTDTQLEAVEQKLNSAYTQKEINLLHSWMLRALSNIEITTWFRRIENSEPLHVLDKLLEQARQQLTTARWITIQEEIAETMLVA